ncbi:MAG: hypothetical protein D6754_16780 [Alphaproteobacteria bacterium]|nr:MAG: hypothetical protein D6754_16780 [Alphaproteobacteria bacterium]
MADEILLERLADYAATQQDTEIDPRRRAMLARVMPAMKERAKTLAELFDMAGFILKDRPIEPDEKAARQLSEEALETLSRLTVRLRHASWNTTDLEAETRAFAEAEGLKLGRVAQPLRAALTGRTVSPPVFDVMATLGREECLARIADAVGRAA